MYGRPKKQKRTEHDKEGACFKLSKKGLLMKCNPCLVVGHNKATCKSSADEITEIQNALAETKRAHIEAVRAETAQRVRFNLSLCKSCLLCNYSKS